jgi:hypothetical protein
MSPLNSKPPDFTAIYFDTNALLGTGWPDPSVLLHNVLVIGRWWGIQVFLPEPVMKEAEEHWLRKVKEAIARGESAANELQRVAKPAVCDARTEHPSIVLLHERYGAKRDEVVTEYAVAISPFTKRSVGDIFELATKYVEPFEYDKKGKGFQDAVILASILEHLVTQPDLKAVFITKDEAFRRSKYQDFVADFDHSRLRIIDLDTVYDELFHPYFDETVLKPWEEERQNALAAAKVAVPELKNFLTAHLSESMLKPGWFAPVVKLLSVDEVRVSSVDTPIPDRNQSADRKVEFTIAVSADCTAIVRKSPIYMALYGFTQGNFKPQPDAPQEGEEKTSWSGGIRAAADVVNRQFQNVVPESLVSEEELRAKH